MAKIAFGGTFVSVNFPSLFVLVSTVSPLIVIRAPTLRVPVSSNTDPETSTCLVIPGEYNRQRKKNAYKKRFNSLLDLILTVILMLLVYKTLINKSYFIHFLTSRGNP